MNHWQVYWEARLGKANRLKTERSGFIETRTAILLPFQSRKDGAYSQLFSAGHKRETAV